MQRGGTRRNGVRSAIVRAARVVGTGLGFLYFAFACLALAVITIPGRRLRGGSISDQQVWSQGWAHLATSSFFSALQLMGLAEFECNDLERLRRPGQLLIANHPTLIDALYMMSLMPQIDCVIKASHARNPVLAGIVSTAGYVLNDDGRVAIDRCVGLLDEGRSVVIFPEGMRSDPGRLNPFGRGAAHIALRSGCDPVPVTIRCEPATLYRGLSWWDVPDRKVRITLDVDEPISLTKLMPEPLPTPRAARLITAALTEHFERQLNRVG